jgi:hypothetical protein
MSKKNSSSGFLTIFILRCGSFFHVNTLHHSMQNKEQLVGAMPQGNISWWPPLRAQRIIMSAMWVLSTQDVRVAGYSMALASLTSSANFFSYDQPFKSR